VGIDTDEISMIEFIDDVPVSHYRGPSVSFVDTAHDVDVTSRR